MFDALQAVHWRRAIRRRQTAIDRGKLSKNRRLAVRHGQRAKRGISRGSARSFTRVIVAQIVRAIWQPKHAVDARHDVEEK